MEPIIDSNGTQHWYVNGKDITTEVNDFIKEFDEIRLDRMEY